MQAGARRHRRGGVQDGLVGALDLIGVAQVEMHHPRLGLVRDIRAFALQHDRKAERRRCRDRRAGFAHKAFGHDRHAV